MGSARTLLRLEVYASAALSARRHMPVTGCLSVLLPDQSNVYPGYQPAVAVSLSPATDSSLPPDMNDQSALLWTEGSRVFFWGGGGGQLQFKVAVSDDSGVSNRRRHRQRFLI